jgi:ADP-ribose pyrophosphatase YjhB (NUDIX family)
MMQIFWVAIKVLISNNQGEILIVYKSDKDEVNPNDYDIPWGRLEFWEKIEDGIKREVREELWIEIEIGKPNRVRWFTKNDLHLVGITFLAKYLWGKIILSFEHTNYIRKTKDEILAWDFPWWLKEEIHEIVW